MHAEIYFPLLSPLFVYISLPFLSQHLSWHLHLPVSLHTHTLPHSTRLLYTDNTPSPPKSVVSLETVIVCTLCCVNLCIHLLCNVIPHNKKNNKFVLLRIKVTCQLSVALWFCLVSIKGLQSGWLRVYLTVGFFQMTACSKRQLTDGTDRHASV